MKSLFNCLRQLVCCISSALVFSYTMAQDCTQPIMSIRDELAETAIKPNFDITISTLVEIVEPDWLDVLDSRVKEADRLGLFAQKRRQIRTAFEKLAQEPRSLGLSRSESISNLDFEWSRYDALNKQDKSFTEALSHFERTYVFVDLGDAIQVAWLKDYFAKVKMKPKVVAVGGSLKEVAKELRNRIYYDQGQRLVKTFGVTCSPSIVRLYARSFEDTETISIRANLQTFDMSSFQKTKKVSSTIAIDGK